MFSTPDLWWGILILAAGTASAVLGIIYALKEHDIKAMLAYSSIENIGIIFMGIGLFIIFTAAGLPLLATISLLGALFHALNHALFKSLLFLTAGSVVHATHTRDIEHMGGLARRMPYTSALFFIGAVSISALPPLNGFASEILIFILVLLIGFAVVDPLLKVLLFICLALFALTSALSAACFVKAFGSIFLALPRSPESEGAREVPRLMLIGPAILAAACILLGLCVAPGLCYRRVSRSPFRICCLSVPPPRYGSPRVWIFLIHCIPRGADKRDMGMRHALPAAVHRIYRPRFLRADRHHILVDIPDPDQERTELLRPMNCIFREGTAEIRLMKVFEEYLYLPVARLTVSRLQLGLPVPERVPRHLSPVCLCTVVAIIVFLGWFA